MRVCIFFGLNGEECIIFTVDESIHEISVPIKFVSCKGSDKSMQSFSNHNVISNAYVLLLQVVLM